ncbi:TniB family NTP-binding protein [Asticcacaulis benevestitus]|uniref:AAA+ ATPase domain-containing protein n=1 Tax=Asticcacaulis benevestitus DSM 16100 = ATCC BAA-896 TaxID=1121022 RepID=V4P9R6_9CAUL|nr:TniB family NTP-binding protein [Asticcacaulis benevestitus]ESQ81990.1 hypothetical protein ABENE_21325 [Asticcacaulis benevestitus DSM 16100 = ATCC BAA-896]
MNNMRIMPETGLLNLDYTAAKNEEATDAVARFSAVFINTPHHLKLESAIDALRLLGLKTVGRPQRALRCLAPSSTGKSTVAKRYRDRVNVQVPIGEERLPILYVSLENATTAKQLMITMLDELKDPVSDRGTAHLLKRRLISLLKHYQVEIIILDEIHHLAGHRNMREIINALKAFLNNQVCPMAFLGTEDASLLFTSNKELMAAKLGDKWAPDIAVIRYLRKGETPDSPNERKKKRLQGQLQKLKSFREIAASVESELETQIQVLEIGTAAGGSTSDEEPDQTIYIEGLDSEL